MNAIQCDNCQRIVDPDVGIGWFKLERARGISTLTWGELPRALSRASRHHEWGLWAKRSDRHGPSRCDPWPAGRRHHLGPKRRRLCLWGPGLGYDQRRR